MPPFVVEQQTLPGGLRTILVPRTEGQTVTFLVLIGVGSRYETEQSSGLSHFLEHMFFKGTETRPSAKAIAEAIESVGGEFNAFTSEEYTGYYVKVTGQHLEHGAEVVSDILLRPLFLQEEIDRERGVIIEEIRMYTGIPMRHIHHVWQRALWGDHPLGRRVDGSEATVAQFMRDDFLGYTRQHYHTENAVVVVAGQFDPSTAKTLLAQLFAPLAVGKETFPKPAPKRLPHERLVSEYRKELDQAQMIVGVPGVDLRDDRRWAAKLLATVLGEGMSSRMFQVVRERNGLAYAIKTELDSMTDTGSLATQAGVRTDKARFALELILQEYDRVMQEPVSAAELAKAKEMVRGSLLLDLEETNALAVFTGGQELLVKEVLTPEEIIARVLAVTADDVQRVAQELLAPEKRAVALLSPDQDTTAFAALLT